MRTFGELWLLLILPAYEFRCRRAAVPPLPLSVRSNGTSRRAGQAHQHPGQVGAPGTRAPPTATGTPATATCARALGRVYTALHGCNALTRGRAQFCVSHVSPAGPSLFAGRAIRAPNRLAKRLCLLGQQRRALQRLRRGARSRCTRRAAVSGTMFNVKAAHRSCARVRAAACPAKVTIPVFVPPTTRARRRRRAPAPAHHMRRREERGLLPAPRRGQDGGHGAPRPARERPIHYIGTATCSGALCSRCRR